MEEYMEDPMIVSGESEISLLSIDMEDILDLKKVPKEKIFRVEKANSVSNFSTVNSGKETQELYTEKSKEPELTKTNKRTKKNENPINNIPKESRNAVKPKKAKRKLKIMEMAMTSQIPVLNKPVFGFIKDLGNDIQ